MKDKITFQEFLEIEKKLEIRIGSIVSAQRIPKSKKLLRLGVMFKTPWEAPVTVVTNLGDKYEPEFFLGLKAPFIMNLEPTTMMGVTSEAMIMVGENIQSLNEIDIETYSIGTKIL